jgi:hypothetical protein
MCRVPDLTGLTPDQVGGAWAGAGFTQAPVFNPLAQDNSKKVKTQDIAAGLSRQCATTVITVSQS